MTYNDGYNFMVYAEPHMLCAIHKPVESLSNEKETKIIKEGTSRRIINRLLSLPH
jgi:hypothetical protein